MRSICSTLAVALVLALTLAACQSTPAGGSGASAKPVMVYVPIGSEGAFGDDIKSTYYAEVDCPDCKMKVRMRLVRDEAEKDQPRTIYIPLGEPGADGVQDSAVCNHCGKPMRVHVKARK